MKEKGLYVDAHLMIRLLLVIQETIIDFVSLKQTSVSLSGQNKR